MQNFACDLRSKCKIYGQIDTLCNYAMASSSTMTFAPSKLSLYLSAVCCNSLESCYINHAPSTPIDILHQIIAFLANEIPFVLLQTLAPLIVSSAS